MTVNKGEKRWGKAKVAFVCLHCSKAAYARGVCRAHYNAFLKSVTDGETTWEELTELELVKGSKHGRQSEIRRLLQEKRSERD